MSNNNRELSQFASRITVDDTTNKVSIASTLELSGGADLEVDGELTAAGAGTFKGKVLVGDTTTTGTNVKVTRSDSGNVWSGNSATDHTSAITKDGTASFKGDLRVGNTVAFAGAPLEIEVTGSASGAVGISLINNKDQDASATCVIRAYQDVRSAGDIVFGRENASDWSASAASADGFISFNPALNGSTVERLRIASDGQATFDKGAPSSSDQVIATFQCENSRKLNIVWHDSGSGMGFDLPGSHFYTFSNDGSEKLRITTEGYPWIKNIKTTSFTNASTVTILTIGDHTNAVVKFILHASDTGYRQNEWAGEYTAFVSNANGSPGVSYYLKEHWQEDGSGSWSSPTVTVSIDGSGQVQFNADNAHNDANGTVDVVILSVTSTNTTIPTIS